MQSSSKKIEDLPIIQRVRVNVRVHRDPFYHYNDVKQINVNM